MGVLEGIMQEPYGGDITADTTGTDSPRKDWRETAHAVAERAGDAASEVKRGARRIADEASETLRGAKDKVTAAYGRTTETAERAYRGAREYATENPRTAAAVTFAAGIGVGMMLAPRKSRHSFERGLIPVVAIALAQAVLDVFDGAR
jgi:ElaB/YqjD/DUF883 family membrane-anchored ribosome-binding protein